MVHLVGDQPFKTDPYVSGHALIKNTSSVSVKVG